jgi:hypothetical protein
MGNWVSLPFPRLLAYQTDSQHDFGRRMAERPPLSIAAQSYRAG